MRARQRARERCREIVHRGPAQHPLAIRLPDELRDPAGCGRDERDALLDAFASRTEKLHEVIADLEKVDEQRRRLLSHVVRAQEDERTRIANDIHDDPLQKLVAAKMQTELVQRAQKNANALTLAQLSEEREAADLRAAVRRPRRWPSERGRLAKVLNRVCRLGHGPGVLAHPVEQPPARADDVVGEFERRSLRYLLAEAIERVRDLLGERRQHAPRAVAVDDEGGACQRPARLPRA